MKLKAITIVFIEPSRKRKDLFDCSDISEPNTAACPEPMPGRKEARGDTKAETREILRIFFGRENFLNGIIICFGIFVLFLIEMMIAEAPNKPERRGSMGSCTGRLKVSNPRNPERKKIIPELMIDFSLKIK